MKIRSVTFRRALGVPGHIGMHNRAITTGTNAINPRAVLTQVPEGIMMSRHESAQTGSSHFVLVPWGSIESVDYEPDAIPEVAAAPAAPVKPAKAAK